MALNGLFILLGIALVLLTLNDGFQSIIVPRAVGQRLRPSYFAWRTCWKLWPVLAWRLYPEDAERRENMLAAFAPGILIGLLVLWVSLLAIGYGTILWGLRTGLAPHPHWLGDTVYFAGTSLTTIGFGDVVGRSVAARLVSLVAGATGLGLFAIFTAYVFALFAAFQNRESFVVMLGARTGTPPSGVDLLAIAGYAQTVADFSALLMEGQRWTAQVMESHLAYPPLAYFRSSHDYQSWVGTLGTLLDAATLLMTTVESAHAGESRISYNLGRHATHDLVNHLNIPKEPELSGLERAEFDRACDRLTHAGYALRDRDVAWERFSTMRTTYAPQLNALARFFEIPPLQWIGDRGTVSGPH